MVPHRSIALKNDQLHFFLYIFNYGAKCLKTVILVICKNLTTQCYYQREIKLIKLPLDDNYIFHLNSTIDAAPGRVLSYAPVTCYPENTVGPFKTFKFAQDFLVAKSVKEDSFNRQITSRGRFFR